MTPSSPGGTFGDTVSLRFVLLSAMLVAIFGTYWRIFGYPFIYDDWGVLRSIEFDHGLNFLRSAFSPVGKVVYRPLGAMYFQLIYTLFNLNPAWFHLAALFILFCTSLLVVETVRIITGEPVIAWSAGFLYATAATVHMDPILWLVGFYDLGCALFFILSVFLFIREKYFASAAIYLLGVLTKEATVALPLVLLTYQLTIGRELSNEKIVWRIKKLSWHMLVLLLYTTLKLVGISPFAAGESSPMAAALIGPHLVENIYTYFRWGLDIILPVKEIPMERDLVQGIALGTILISLASIIFWSRREKGKAIVRRRRQIFVLLVTWCIAGALPVLFLTHHAARYFFTCSLDPFIVIVLLVLSTALQSLRISGRILSASLIIYTILIMGSSFTYFLQKDKAGKYVEGTYNLIWKGKLTKRTQSWLSENYPTLPESSALVFTGGVVNTIAGDAGPQVWYHDTTIQVYDGRTLGIDSGGTFARTSWPLGLKFYIDPQRTLKFDYVRDTYVRDSLLLPYGWTGKKR
jgi:hypothetical protein